MGTMPKALTFERGKFLLKAVSSEKTRTATQNESVLGVTTR